MMIDDEDENLADDWAAALGDSEDGGDLADEWAAMAEGGGDDGFSESSRVLDQAEIDSLLGFQLTLVFSLNQFSFIGVF